MAGKGTKTNCHLLLCPRHLQPPPPETLPSTPPPLIPPHHSDLNLWKQSLRSHRLEFRPLDPQCALYFPIVEFIALRLLNAHMSSPLDCKFHGVGDQSSILHRRLSGCSTGPGIQSEGREDKQEAGGGRETFVIKLLVNRINLRFKGQITF